MNLTEVVDGLSCLSMRTLALAMRKPSALRTYVSYCLKRYDELTGAGLASRGPVIPSNSETISLPSAHTGGGMSFSELVILARATKTRKPSAIFEIGSYDGLTTAVFILNSPREARIFSLDLPPEAPKTGASLESDKDLVAARHLGSVPRALGLSQYTQLLCDSMMFDPEPYANSIDLGLVDAAHDVEHVRNDTIKMARMMTDDGMVFWHDYGGKGAFRPLAAYLENLAKWRPIYRIPETSLAWAYAKDLKEAVR
jgi:Methyltransferase domain